MSNGWKFHLFRLPGDGTAVDPVWNIPLNGPQVTEDLSGPGQVSATAKPELLQGKDEKGRPLFVPYQTALAAEYAGRVPAVALVTDTSVDLETLTITAAGLRSYWTGMPYTGDYSKVQVDPLDVLRHIVAHVQGFKRGDLGIKVDGTKSPVRIGEPERDVSFQTKEGDQVDFEAGPYKLNWWSTDDLGKEIDDLATETPFDYRMTHKLSPAGHLTHRMELGYPRLGVRRHQLRFVVGENITVMPVFEDAGADYADEVYLLGAGEGRVMIRGHAYRASDRLRRPRIVSDKTVQNTKRADVLAAAEVQAALGVPDISEVVVRDHGNARFGSWQVGDEILVQAPTGWHPASRTWVRILSQTWEPEAGTVKLAVTRGEKVR